MAGSFSAARIRRLPRWLGGLQGTSSYGARYQRGAGDAQDAELSLLKQSVRLRFVQDCPDDGLVFAGADRLVRQAPIEGPDAFRARLLEAPAENEWIGTRRGVSWIFSPYGFTSAPDVAVDEATCRVWHNYEIDWDPGDVDEIAAWARVWITLSDIGLWTTSATWDAGGVWDDGGIWDAEGLGTADLTYMRASVFERKSKIAFPRYLMICLVGGELWSDPGLWDDPGTWPDDLAVLPVLLGANWDDDDVWGDGETVGAWRAFQET